MTNTSSALLRFEPPASAPKTHGDRDRAELAGTRLLIADEYLSAILQLMIDTNLVSKKSAAVMLDRLSSKLMIHALGLTETLWEVRAPELLDQATRLATKAAAMRAAGGGLS